MSKFVVAFVVLISVSACTEEMTLGEASQTVWKPCPDGGGICWDETPDSAPDAEPPSPPAPTTGHFVVLDADGKIVRTVDYERVRGSHQMGLSIGVYSEDNNLWRAYYESGNPEGYWRPTPRDAYYLEPDCSGIGYFEDVGSRSVLGMGSLSFIPSPNAIASVRECFSARRAGECVDISEFRSGVDGERIYGEQRMVIPLSEAVPVTMPAEPPPRRPFHVEWR